MNHLRIGPRPSYFLPYLQELRCRLGRAGRVFEDLGEEEGIFDCLACTGAVVRQ